MLDYDPFSEEVMADPYPAYARLRTESPVHYLESSRAHANGVGVPAPRGAKPVRRGNSSAPGRPPRSRRTPDRAGSMPGARPAAEGRGDANVAKGCASVVRPFTPLAATARAACCPAAEAVVFWNSRHTRSSTWTLAPSRARAQSVGRGT